MHCVFVEGYVLGNRIVYQSLWLLFVALCAGHTAAQEAGPQTDSPIRSRYGVVYRTVGGEQVKADVFWPKADGLYPAVILIHGGAWSSGDKWNMHDHARQLAQAGYVACAINYRLAPRYLIESQIDDCRAALRWLADSGDQFNADTARLGLWGYSAGAHLACLIGYRQTEDQPAVRAIVAGGTPCDFSAIPGDSRILAMVMGGSPNEKPQLYRDIAPINFVGPKCPPTFFFHGTKDFIVPQKASLEMCEKLGQCGVTTEYFEVQDQGHLITFIDSKARLKAIAFLDKYLKANP